MYRYITILLLCVFVAVNSASAVQDASIAQCGEEFCETGQYCRTFPLEADESPQCRPCENAPVSTTGVLCGENVIVYNCQYTDSNGDKAPGNCSWKLTCDANDYWDDTSRACIPCPQDKPHSYGITLEYSATQGSSTDGLSTYFIKGQPILPEDRRNQCLPDTIECADAPELTAKVPLVCSGGIGKRFETSVARWDSDRQDYNYSECTCIKNGVSIIDVNNSIIGTGTVICDFNADGSVGNNCPTSEVTSCIAGYCDAASDNETTCVPAPAGYYSPVNDVACTKCSGGATSEAGSDNAGACYYGAGTVFIDSLGSFKIPLSGKISVSIKSN